VIGSWEVDGPPFAGNGIALIRPEAFSNRCRGEESDLIFGIEEASFVGGRWLLRGVLSAGSSCAFPLPAGSGP